LPNEKKVIRVSFGNRQSAIRIEDPTMAGKVSSNPNEFLLPDLGEGLQEAELIEWCVQVGQHVNEFDTLAKMETDKALVEVPSPRAGTIKELRGSPGEKIPVGSVLVVYDGSEAAQKKPATVEAAKAVNAPQRTDAPQGSMDPQTEREDAGTVVGSLTDLPGVGGEGKVRAAPAVRRLARDLGVDIERVRGTGIGGRVTSGDVQAAADAIKSGRAAPASRPAARTTQQQPPPPPRVAAHTAGSNGNEVERIPFRGVRRTIAERLRQSVNFAVHFNVMDEADVSAADALRRKLSAASGEKLSLLPFVASAVCRVLSGRLGPQFAVLNSTVDDEKQEIAQHRSVHLGIATDTTSGLMVPVIRDAATLGVLEMSRAIAQLAQSARDRSIPRDQLTGSTFTISNVGSYAGRFATPIINYPEVGILAAGRARDGVIVKHGMIGIGKMLPLSLAADHRVVDGATAAMALAKIIELLQDPEQLLGPSA
jgi:pyruvate dehydrogenase E2 component (dihydrolipoamide acetyltransferase)